MRIAGTRPTITFGLGIALLLAVVVRPVAAQEHGTVVIETRDQDGNLIPGACYVVEGAPSSDLYCDEVGDGQIQLVEVPVGEWVVWEDSAPKGYQLIGDASQLVFVDPGTTVTVVFVYAPLVGDGTIVVEVRDDETYELLGGGCYAVRGPASDPGVEVCDNDQNDADPSVGRVEIGGLPTGYWEISEIYVLDGYQLVGAPVLAVEVRPGATVVVVFQHVPIEQESDLDDRVIETDAPDLPYEPVEVTPPARVNLTPTCAGVKATIVVATSANGKPTKAVGTNGDDVIVGTAGPDVIAGLGGHDRICTLDGADIVDAGEGNDLVEGGAGDDTVAGGAGADHLDGGAGKHDQCDGGTTANGFENDTAAGCETKVAIP